MQQKNLMKRFSAWALAGTMILGAAVPAHAEIPDGVEPEVDEAYYVLMDYYGNPTDTSVVKSYTMNGADRIVDYGTYDSVQNLSNSVKPTTDGDKVTFDFGDSAPENFYFEGKTGKPFETLPWTISVSYKLNGAPAKAEDLAGAKGMVEIDVKATPKKKGVTKYMQNNWFLTAIAAFNQDDIISVEAPDAQMQTIGNIRCALFAWLPGENKEFTIRVGADSFEYDGLTFLMGPVNAHGRLKDLEELRDTKEDMEDSWDDLEDAMDNVLDSLDTMKGNLNGAADSLDKLDDVRADVHSHQSEFYGDLDSFLGDMNGLSADLAPMSGHLDAANNTVTDVRSDLNDLNGSVLNTKKHLEDMQSTLRSLSKDMTNLGDVTSDLDSDTRHVKDDVEDLQNISRRGRNTVSSNISGTLSEMEALYKAYASYMKSKGMEPVDRLGDGRVLYDLDSRGTASNASVSPSEGSASADVDDAGSLGISGVDYPEGSFQDFVVEKLESLGYDEDSIAFALALWDNRDDVQSFASSAGSVFGTADTLADDILDLETEELFDLLTDISVDGQQGFSQLDELDQDLAKALGQLDKLHSSIDSYIPELQTALSDSASLCDSLTHTSASLTKFLTTARNIMKENSDKLNDASKGLLNNSSDLLRKSSGTLDSTDDARKAKDSLSDLVDDKWDEYTGDKSNLFKIESDAPARSLTSYKNTDIRSVSVLIRTKEIQIPDDSGALSSADDTDHRTFLQRVQQMFLDIWSFFTGLFHKA